jgi:hypothetical protein
MKKFLVICSFALLLFAPLNTGKVSANAHVQKKHTARQQATAGMTFNVDSTLDEADATPDDGKCKSMPSHKCTLRAAIMQNNALGGGNTIMLPAGTFDLTLGDPAEPSEDTGARGDLDVLAKVNLKGAGADTTIIDGKQNDRVFDLFGKAKISRVTIQNGATTENGGGIRVGRDAKLTLKDSTVTNNEAVNGSGVYGGGSLTIKNSKILRNLCGHQGSGVYIGYGGGISQTQISRNCADQGGGIFAIDLTDTGVIWQLDASTVNDNRAREGGGIFSYAGAHVLNSTIANNHANLGTGGTGEGGGVYAANGGNVFGDFYFYNTTIASNTAGSGGTAGGIYSLTGASPRLKNTILDNVAPDDCEGDFTLLGYNLIFNPNGCTLNSDPSTQTGIHADLQTLANYGGPTPTMALQSTSEAIDAIPVSYCTDFSSNPLTTDQRGFVRPTDGDGNGKKKCDIGAFEVQP